MCLAISGSLLFFASRSRSVADSGHLIRPERPAEVRSQSQEEAEQKSTGCISCHTSTDEPTMHPTKTVLLGCTDCHGGNGDVRIAAGVAASPAEYTRAKEKAHVQPRDLRFKERSALPERTYTAWLRESKEYVRFRNPGDLRVAAETCGPSGCHASEVRAVSTSMMTHAGFLWGAALYNNGAFPKKNAYFGESYSPDGQPQAIRTAPAPTPEEVRKKGIVPELVPLERWEIAQPGNVLRVFERGGKRKAEVGNPVREDEPGKPEDKLSERGFGTELRTDPVFLGLQKTRLLDPILSFPGTNDHPGDYRSSGCSACHVVYAEDRASEHSGPYAAFGHSAMSASSDPTIPKNESGHPIRHVFTRAIPSSQCMVCHIHPGTNMVATYFGYTWWDNELDADKMYPKQQHNPSEEERYQFFLSNPEGAAARGLWGDEKFLEQIGNPEFNGSLKTTQFADFHGHGWVFRAVYNHDRKGNWLDAEGKPIAFDDPQRFTKAVHLADIHLEKGMHCVDCHFAQDNHGNGNIYAEPRAAVEIDCVDCHGTVRGKAALVGSGPAAPAGGRRLDALRTPWGLRRFEWRGEKLFQHSMLEENKEWEIVQVLDTVTPGNPHFNAKSLRAKLMNKDGVVQSQIQPDDTQLAHGNAKMRQVLEPHLGNRSKEQSDHHDRERGRGEHHR